MLRGKVLTFESLLTEFKKFLTGKWVDSNSGTHFLKLNPELGALSDFLLVFAGKLLQVGLECLQLFRHLEEEETKSLNRE